MELLTPDPGLLFWMLIVFGIVFFVLAKYGFPVILKMVEERKSFIDQSLLNARQANEQLVQIKEQGERIIAQAHEEQARILKAAAERSDAMVQEAKERAAAEGQRMLDDVKQQIEVEKERAVRDIRCQIALLSVGVAEKILREKLSQEDTQMQMVDRMVDEMVQNFKD